MLRLHEKRGNLATFRQDDSACTVEKLLGALGPRGNVIIKGSSSIKDRGSGPLFKGSQDPEIVGVFCEHMS